VRMSRRREEPPKMPPPPEPVRGRSSIAVSEGLRKRTGCGIVWLPSPHFEERKTGVDTVVLHYTATGSLEETADLLLKQERPVSVHYVIGRDGRIVQMVDLEKKAWHAGESMFQGRPDVNDFSIGIELVNWGLLKRREGTLFVWPGEYGTEYPGESAVYAGGQWWDRFTETQYGVLGDLIGQIRVFFPAITPERIVGHAEVALPRGRKIDPGLAFDWERVRGNRRGWG